MHSPAIHHPDPSAHNPKVAGSQIVEALDIVYAGGFPRTEKAAVLVERLARNHPLPDGNKRAAFLSAWLFMELTAGPSRAKIPTPTSR